jgi:prolyl-tRNA synthetase
MLQVYATFAEEYMALPVIKGVKTESEKFAGAIDTYTIETLMQDGKALQGGTSHFLGQNFARAFDVKYLNKEGQLDLVWATSWGVTTRLIGALIMAHSDDNGLILPPKLAPIHVVIVPIHKNEEQLALISAKAEVLKKELESKGLSVKYDGRDTHKPGWKFAEYELKGVPVRLAIGPRDLENNTVEVARRDTLEKMIVPADMVGTYIPELLAGIQENIFKRASGFRERNTHTVNTWDEFREVAEVKGGFAYAHWDGTPETEAKIKEETKATIRCIPLDNPLEEGKCIYSGKPSSQRVLFAVAY